MADFHPMKALFMIPKADAPRLEDTYCSDFRSFVEMCLQKDPRNVSVSPLLRFPSNPQRATSKALLQHPFVRQAGPTSDLETLVKRYQTHKANRKKKKTSQPDPATIMGATVKTEWDFDDTIRGTLKGVPVQLNLEALEVGAIRFRR